MNRLVELFDPPMRDLLTCIAHRLVVVGSVARTIRDKDFRLPKDIDLLCDLDSEAARAEISNAVAKAGLRFESPFLASWTFRDYGWMVEIISFHAGPAYKTIRRRAERIVIDGVSLFVARPEDAPPAPSKRQVGG